MRKTNYFLLAAFLGLFLLTRFVSAQNYFVLNNSAKRVGDSIFQLTPSSAWKNGSVWFQKRLDLKSNFLVIAELNFGSRTTNGADGMAFVLQPLSANQGSSGGGMGYWGVKPSMAVEFDDFQNPGWDPTEDHIALVQNGDIYHYTLNTISGPHKLSYSLEDGKWHTAAFQWSASSKKFRCVFDGIEIFDKTIDMVKDVFKDSSFVYFGFTGATGDKFNAHQVKINKFQIKIENSCELGIDSLLVQHVSCFGGKDGQIFLSDTGGQGEVSYKWNPTSIGTTSKANNLKAGRYLAVATDSQGCKDQLWININEPAAIVTDLTSSKSACKGTNSGEIELTSKNHKGELSWSISPKTSTTNSSILGPKIIYSGLPPDQYTIIQTDTSNCKDTSLIIVKEGDKIYGQIDTSINTCSDLSLGIIKTSALTGIQPFTWLISPSVGSQLTVNGGRNAYFENLQKGTYRIYLIDSVGCGDTINTRVESVKSIQSRIDSVGASCEINNGFINASTSNGIPPYSWSINPVDGNFSANNNNSEIVFANLKSGDYTFQITDSLGCRDTLKAVVSNYSISANITSTDVACKYGKLGRIDVECLNGTLPFNWAIIPNDGTILEKSLVEKYEFTNLKAGNYTLLLVDSNGCKDTLATLINQINAELQVSNIKNSCFKGEKGRFEGLAVSGKQPYNWSLEPMAFGISQTTYNIRKTYENVPAGNYSLILKDANDCLDSQIITVKEIPKINLQIDSFAGDIYNGEVTFHSTINPSGKYYYQWSPPEIFGSQVNSKNPKVMVKGGQQIQLLVSDTNGCYELVDYKVFGDVENIHHYAPNAFTPDGNTLNETYKAKGNFSSVRYKVFNLWGECLFVSTASEPEWNGYYMNYAVPEGVYVIISDMYWDSLKIRKVIAKDVTLLR